MHVGHCWWVGVQEKGEGKISWIIARGQSKPVARHLDFSSFLRPLGTAQNWMPQQICVGIRNAIRKCYIIIISYLGLRLTIIKSQLSFQFQTFFKIEHNTFN